MEPKKLPNKEAGLMRTVLKLHQSKQYKRALKHCETILKRFPDHGETLAMKGLCIFDSNPDRREEAFELARQGIKVAMRSSVVWHVYGLMNRTYGDLEQASKCFLQAYRLNNDDVNILRDLTYLLIQTRHLEEYNEYGRQLLTKTSNRMGYWLAFAVSFHLLKDYAGALHVLEVYEETLESKKAIGIEGQDKIDFSERILYKVHVLMESGDLEAALNHLVAMKKHIQDKSTKYEMLVTLYTKLGRKNDALKYANALLMRNPDNVEYWRKYFLIADFATKVENQTMMNLEPAVPDSMIIKLNEYGKMFARAFLPQRLPLDIMKPDGVFRQVLDNYLKRGFRKGIPSLFSDLRSLYNVEEKVVIIGELLTEYENSLSQSPSRFPESETDEVPSVIMWVWLFRARHEVCLGNIQEGLDFADRSIEHTPTYIDAYVVKSKIQKTVGDFVGAQNSLDTARRMDLADRYINTKHCAALLRAGDVDRAESIFQLFTKTDEPLSNADGVLPSEDTPFTALVEMQVVWFELMAGRAYMATGKRGLALRMFRRLEKHYQQWRDDEADFDYYCMRKATLRSFCQLLDWEDNIFSQTKYQEAALSMIKIYITLFNDPVGEKERKEEEERLASMTPAERKKAVQKAKKKVKKEAQSGSNSGGSSSGKPVKKTDLDPNELEQVKDPLLEAKRLLKSVLSFSKDRIGAHSVEYDIYSRYKIPLRCAHALIGISNADSDDDMTSCALLPRLCDFTVNFTNVDGAVKQAIEKGLEPVIQSVLDQALVYDEWTTALRSYIERQSSSIESIPTLSRRLAVAESMLVFGHPAIEAVKIPVSFDGLSTPPLSTCIEVLGALEAKFGDCLDGIGQYKSVCRNLHPYANAFE